MKGSDLWAFNGIHLHHSVTALKHFFCNAVSILALNALGYRKVSCYMDLFDIYLPIALHRFIIVPLLWDNFLFCFPFLCNPATSITNLAHKHRLFAFLLLYYFLFATKLPLFMAAIYMEYALVLYFQSSWLSLTQLATSQAIHKQNIWVSLV